MELKFRQCAFQVFPKAAAEWVIAHELAHVYQKSIGRMPGGDDEEEKEEHANALANDWGFSRHCLSLVEGIQDGRAGRSLADACREVDRLDIDFDSRGRPLIAG